MFKNKYMFINIIIFIVLLLSSCSSCLLYTSDSGADISAAAAQSGDAPGESAAQAEPGGAEAGPGASAGADGEEAVLYDLSLIHI